jgi:hypothetical protein
MMPGGMRRLARVLKFGAPASFPSEGRQVVVLACREEFVTICRVAVTFE